ncbi:UNVERIFIED_CONTAM: hypothetical protein FKN15_045682 [Acipenser sinensis]
MGKFKEDASLHPETSGEHPEHIPMIPLQPSTRIELHSTSEAPRTNPSPTDPAAPPGIGPTADLPEDLYPQTTPTTPPPTSTTTTSETSVPSHTPAPSREPHSEEVQGGGSSEEEEVGGECSGAALSPDTTRALGGAMMKFGMEVLETLESKSKKTNILLSPLSVVLGLSQLSLGAVNETEAMLRSRLHVSELPCHHHLFKRLRQHLSQSALQVASRVYLKKGFKVKEGFMKDSLQFYGSKPALLEGVDEVNHWVEEATNGRIKDFLSSLPEDVVLLLLNAVHFKVSSLPFFSPPPFPLYFCLSLCLFIRVGSLNNSHCLPAFLPDSPMLLNRSPTMRTWSKPDGPTNAAGGTDGRPPHPTLAGCDWLFLPDTVNDSLSFDSDRVMTCWYRNIEVSRRQTVSLRQQGNSRFSSYRNIEWYLRAAALKDNAAQGSLQARQQVPGQSTGVAGARICTKLRTKCLLPSQVTLYSLFPMCKRTKSSSCSQANQTRCICQMDQDHLFRWTRYGLFLKQTLLFTLHTKRTEPYRVRPKPSK